MATGKVGSSYTAYSNAWTTEMSTYLPKQGLYLFASMRYPVLAYIMRFQNGNTQANIVSGTNWTFNAGTDGNITAQATNQADYYIIPMMPTA